MRGLENIFYNKKIIATIYRRYLSVKGLKFFTDLSNFFQIGIHERTKGVSLIPHIHKLDKPLSINTIQEVLFVQHGRIRIKFYTSSGDLITKKILKTGDCVLLISDGHGVDFLEDSRVLEIKQGPYPGSAHAKIHLKRIIE